MAVKANEVEGDAWVLTAKGCDRLGVKLGQFLLDIADWSDTAEDAAQALAETLRIRHRQRRPSDDTALSVGRDRRDVDTVERGAAHQAQRRPEICRRICVR